MAEEQTSNETTPEQSERVAPSLVKSLSPEREEIEVTEEEILDTTKEKEQDADPEQPVEPAVSSGAQNKTITTSTAAGKQKSKVWVIAILLVVIIVIVVLGVVLGTREEDDEVVGDGGSGDASGDGDPDAEDDYVIDDDYYVGTVDDDYYYGLPDAIDDIDIVPGFHPIKIASLLNGRVAVGSFEDGALSRRLVQESPGNHYVNVSHVDFSLFDEEDLVLYIVESLAYTSLDNMTAKDIRIPNVATDTFPVALPSTFWPGDYNGVMLFDEDIDKGRYLFITNSEFTVYDADADLQEPDDPATP